MVLHGWMLPKSTGSNVWSEEELATLRAKIDERLGLRNPGTFYVGKVKREELERVAVDLSVQFKERCLEAKMAELATGKINTMAVRDGKPKESVELNCEKSAVLAKQEHGAEEGEQQGLGREENEQGGECGEGGEGAGQIGAQCGVSPLAGGSGGECADGGQATGSGGVHKAEGCDEPEGEPARAELQEGAC